MKAVAVGTVGYRLKRKNCALPDFGTVTCHVLPTICGAGTGVQAPVRLELDCSVKPAAASGHESTKLLPDGATLRLVLVVSAWVGPSTCVAAISSA